MLKAGLIREIADVTRKINADKHVVSAMQKILEEATYFNDRSKNYIYYEIDTDDMLVVHRFRGAFVELGYAVEESVDEEYHTTCFTIKW